MDEVVAFCLAFGTKWTSLMSGAAGLVLTGLGYSNKVPGAIGFVIAGILCFFWACFLVWQDEYKARQKLEEDPLLPARIAEFQERIKRLSAHQVKVLRGIMIQGSGANETMIQIIAEKTGLLVFENGAYRPNSFFAEIIGRWIAEADAQKADRLDPTGLGPT